MKAPDNIYMIDFTKCCVFCTTPYIFYCLEVIYTNYSRHRQINRVIMDATGDTSKKKTFTGYIDEIWQEAIKDSDKGVKTGKSRGKEQG